MLHLVRVLVVLWNIFGSVPMLPEYEIFLLLSLLAGFLSGFATWGLWRVGASSIPSIRASLTAVRNDMLLGLSVLGALALGGFLTYALLGL